MSETRAIIIELSDGRKRVETYAYPGAAIGHPMTAEDCFSVMRGMYDLHYRSSGVNVVGYRPLDGLQAASDATCDWPVSGYVSIVRYDPDDCRVWTTEATSDQLAGKYDLFRTARHVSPQRIVNELASHFEGAY